VLTFGKQGLAFGTIGLMSRLFLSDHEWQALYAILRTCGGVYVGEEDKCRRFVNAVLWLARSGAQWRLLPAAYGNWNSVYKRFARWSEKGIWQQLFSQCIGLPDREWLLLDSTTVRAHPCAAGSLKKKADRPHTPSGAVAAGSAPKFMR
jgi:transposase